MKEIRKKERTETLNSITAFSFTLQMLCTYTARKGNGLHGQSIMRPTQILVILKRFSGSKEGLLVLLCSMHSLKTADVHVRGQKKKKKEKKI